MADTIRSLAELNGLLADNISGAIGPQDLRDLMVSQMVHGEIGSSSKASILLGADWQALDFNVAGVFERGLNIDTVNKWIDQIPVDCKAVLTLEVFFKGDVGQDYDFTVFKDPAGTPSNIIRMQRTGHRILNAGQTVHASWSVGVQLNQNDILQPAVRSNGNNFELLFGLFRVQRIGVE
jgi:hypothetical protein